MGESTRRSHEKCSDQNCSRHHFRPRRDGVWEVCTDAGFRGRCVRLQPGEYPNLQGDLNNRISSAREIAQYTPPPPVASPAPGPGYGGPARAVLYEGDCRTFGPGDYPDLPGDLNRRISSGRRIADRYPYGGPANWGR